MVMEQTSDMQIRVAVKSRKVEAGKAEILSSTSPYDEPLMINPQ
jgi:hypothetical protein